MERAGASRIPVRFSRLDGQRHGSRNCEPGTWLRRGPCVPGLPGAIAIRARRLRRRFRRHGVNCSGHLVSTVTCEAFAGPSDAVPMPLLDCRVRHRTAMHQRGRPRVSRSAVLVTGPIRVWCSNRVRRCRLVWWWRRRCRARIQPRLRTRDGGVLRLDQVADLGRPVRLSMAWSGRVQYPRRAPEAHRHRSVGTPCTEQQASM